MWMIFWKAAVTVLVIYAVIDIVRRMVTAVFRKKPAISDDVFLVLKVKNQQSTLEGVVRALIWKHLRLNIGGFVPNILIVDMGSDDDTAEIAKRLCDDYSFIYFTTEEQYNGMKNAFFR